MDIAHRQKGEPMRLIDADAFIEFMKDAVKQQKYEDIKIDGLLTVADVIEAVISELDGTSLAGFKNAPTIDSEQHWIPCSERLPFVEYGESDEVLATCGYLNVEDTSVRWIRELYFNGGNWCYPTGKTYEQKVYAWMPLPEPYQEGEG